MADDARQKAEDHYYAALDLVAEGEPERALAEYQHSLDADPVFTEAMHGMARTLQDLNRLDEAIAVAKRIAELDPDDVLAYTDLFTKLVDENQAGFRLGNNPLELPHCLRHQASLQGARPRL